MPLSPIFVRRSLADTDKLTRLALQASGRIAGKIRARLMEQFRRGTPIRIGEYFVQQLHGLTVTAMLAGHLSGFRRFHLMVKQTPSLMRRLDRGELKLSALDNAVKILETKANIDLNAIGKKFNTDALKVLQDASEEIEQKLNAELKDLIQEGAHAAEAVRRLSDRLAELGISPQKDYVLERIFRTQMQIAFSAGRWQAEQDPDIQEILWGYKYVTVGDDRVREEHAAIDGTVLPKDDAFWQRFYPPNGWNCRCQAIPLFEQREIVRAPQFLGDGITPVEPDKGFDLNFGQLFASAA
jgi:SPP1 gp7 family putative phage head morphogenesis protein